MHDRINVQNNPVNLYDPYGLQTRTPAFRGVPGFPPILPPVFYPGTPENDIIVQDVNRIIDKFRPIPPYEKNKRDFKKHRQPQELKYGGEAKGQTPPPPRDACDALKDAIQSPSFGCKPPAIQFLMIMMYSIGCTEEE